MDVRKQTPPAADPAHLSAKQRLLILSRRDRMGKAMPTWYRMLAICVVLAAAIVVLNANRISQLEQRTTAAEPRTEGTHRLSFAGDLDLDHYVQTLAQKDGWDSLYRLVSPLWESSDFVFACLDGVVLSDSSVELQPLDTAEEPQPLPAEALSAAMRAGINVFALANDRAFDYGSAGVAQTLAALNAEGAAYAGAGENLPVAGETRFLESNGLRVGFLSCSAVNPNGPGPIDNYCLTTTAYSALYRNVYQASQEADFVVVYVCWGELNGLSITQGQRNVAHQLILSGADLVIGTHPHVLQPVEQYRDGWIFYSLGDLVSDRDQRGERESALLRLDLDREAGTGVFTLIPLLLEDFRPAPTQNSFYRNQIHRSLLRNLPEDSYSVTDDGRIQIPIRIS